MHATSRMNLKNIVLSEKSQAQKAHCMILFMHEIPGIGKSPDAESRFSGCHGLGREVNRE